MTDCISHLVTIMCHAGEVDTLTAFTFVGMQDVVERTLAFKARNSDPLASPNYLLVLYSWHIRRGDYRGGLSLFFRAISPSDDFELMLYFLQLPWPSTSTLAS